MPVFHVVYGLRIVSDLPLPGLTISEESSPPDLQIYLNRYPDLASRFSTSDGGLLYSSSNSGRGGIPVLRVSALSDDGYFVFSYVDGVRFAIEQYGREIWADWPNGYSLEDACTYLIGPVIAFALRLRGTVCLHASSIAVGDRAIALIGEPGAGKSTTAAAFASLGFSVLSDDVVVLADQGARFLVQPGYPRINLWPDSVHQLFGSADALSPISPTWDKRYLPLAQSGYHFQDEAVQLGAIYVLGEREAAVTASNVEELSAREAFLLVVGNTYVNYLLDADMRSRDFEVLSRVVAQVPVRRVRPAADSSKIFALCEAISADARQLMAHQSSSTSQKAD